MKTPRPYSERGVVSLQVQLDDQQPQPAKTLSELDTLELTVRSHINGVEIDMHIVRIKPIAITGSGYRMSQQREQALCDALDRAHARIRQLEAQHTREAA